MNKVNHFLNFLALLIFIALSAGSGDGSPRPRRTGSENTIDATMMCEEFVKKRLKSPYSAKFPYSDAIYLSDDSTDKIHKYKLSSYVDSQNSFGAMIRTSYTCIISNEEGSGTWSLINLKMN